MSRFDRASAGVGIVRFLRVNALAMMDLVENHLATRDLQELRLDSSVAVDLGCGLFFK